MTGSGLVDFLIGLIVLCAVVVMVFKAIEFVSPDARFTLIARWAIGVVAVIALLVAVKGVLFGGAMAGSSLSGSQLIDFAIGLIVLMVVVWLIYTALDYMAPSPPINVAVKYVVGALFLIALLVLAKQVLFGGGIQLGSFRQHSEIFIGYALA